MLEFSPIITRKSGFFRYLCSIIFTIMEAIIKEARKEDAMFVAWGVCTALHSEMSEEQLKPIAGICSREDVLYSYRHALIAWVDGKPAGLCLAYNGEGYHEIRLRTFALFQVNDSMDLENAEDETCAGEYYIDSLAVKPEYRRQGIARKLMEAQIKRGLEKGLAHITLLVDPENPNAQKLYKELGFEYLEDCYAFGQVFWKWGLSPDHPFREGRLVT